IYERLGVTEYWQFDPTGDYLDPILKGRALADGRYRELELERRDGGLCRCSEVLGLDLRLEGGRLRFFDPKRGEYLLTPEEQRQVIGAKDRALEHQRHALRERDRTVDRQRRALEAAEARIRELERRRREG
ncbi:MAG: Uma2 family endonuclease, partial [Gammaproteobacteria bacterium]|nr:Uma2 family endonuclease [Gammaproteobacteria bacterium]